MYLHFKNAGRLSYCIFTLYRNHNGTCLLIVMQPPTNRGSLKIGSIKLQWESPSRLPSLWHCVCAAESRQRQREVSYIIHAILWVFSDHCDRDMTESLRDLGNTQLFTHTLHTLSLMAWRKQLESSHVTLNASLVWHITHNISMLRQSAAQCTYAQKHTPTLSLTSSVYMSNTEFNMACVWLGNW